ncbi:hypothetical protein LshimejAT787_1103710 [Lyophyllum shimeji]|uniref:Uncharacterized protein n=1 Tax=Lyophyllum shimeji TaxID=47721 RepID=A0A9P3UTP0_LYOSH|nr:hypothetical protein LshimejAT787_1103710 [Lyophyllum shimeji]
MTLGLSQQGRTHPYYTTIPRVDTYNAITKIVGHIVDSTCGHECRGSATPPEPKPRGPVDPAAQGDPSGSTNLKGGGSGGGKKGGGTKNGGTKNGGTKNGGTKGPKATRRSS